MKIGDKVKLVNLEPFMDEGYYGNVIGNSGEIVDIDEREDLPYKVLWDCGNSNSYGKSNLELIRR